MTPITRTCIQLMLASCALGAGLAYGGEGLERPGETHRFEGGQHGRPHGARDFPGPELSEAQQDKLFAIHHAMEPQLREQERAARKAHDALRELAASGQFDEAKASALAQAEGKAVAAIALLRAKADAQRAAVLTPEQRQALKHDFPGQPPRP